LALESAGHSVTAFLDPSQAWDALISASEVDLLITRVAYPPGKPNGLTLAMLARTRWPTIGVIFTALPENAHFVDAWARFLAIPVNVADLVHIATRILNCEWNSDVFQRRS
jgi:DNA-binding NtrC family response regulator